MSCEIGDSHVIVPENSGLLKCDFGCVIYIRGASIFIVMQVRFLDCPLPNPSDKGTMIIQNTENHSHSDMTLCHSPENVNPQQHCCENLKHGAHVLCCTK
jgi:hypothetical protein